MMKTLRVKPIGCKEDYNWVFTATQHRDKSRNWVGITYVDTYSGPTTVVLQPKDINNIVALMTQALKPL